MDTIATYKTSGKIEFEEQVKRMRKIEKFLSASNMTDEGYEFNGILFENSKNDYLKIFKMVDFLGTSLFLEFQFSKSDKWLDLTTESLDQIRESFSNGNYFSDNPLSSVVEFMKISNPRNFKDAEMIIKMIVGTMQKS